MPSHKGTHVVLNFSLSSSFIWHVVVLYFLVTARTPFGGDTVVEVRDRILQGKYEMPCNLSEGAVVLCFVFSLYHPV